jgi:hypothetical protein
MTGGAARRLAARRWGKPKYRGGYAGRPPRRRTRLSRNERRRRPGAATGWSATGPGCTAPATATSPTCPAVSTAEITASNGLSPLVQTLPPGALGVTFASGTKRPKPANGVALGSGRVVPRRPEPREARAGRSSRWAARPDRCPGSARRPSDPASPGRPSRQPCRSAASGPADTEARDGVRDHRAAAEARSIRGPATRPAGHSRPALSDPL